MSSFNARLRLPGRSRLPLGVEVDIFHERMTMTAGDRTVAAWPLDRLEVVSLSDGFHIKVDGEEMVLSVTDSKRFASELGIGGRPPADASQSKQPAGAPDQSHLIDLQRRIADVSDALASDAISPAEAFARWLNLLKELNRRHGQGTMPSDLYYRLNTQLLDLIPAPTPIPA